MNKELFNRLYQSLKILYQNRIEIPEPGYQLKYLARQSDDEREEFTIIINRKGYLNPDYLTYQINSRHGILIRIDMDGQPHENRNNQLIETPHVHIFNEAYDNGKIAIALNEITDVKLLVTIIDSLNFFFEYNNISLNNIQLPLF